MLVAVVGRTGIDASCAVELFEEDDEGEIVLKGEGAD